MIAQCGRKDEQGNMIRRFGLFGATMLVLLMPFLYVMIFTTLLLETKSARHALRMTWGAD